MNQTICRLCYINPGITSVYDNSSGVQISAKIMYCCKNIRISEDENFPVHICKLCENELESSYCFILKCEETDKKLRSNNTKCLKNESKAKIEIKEELEHFILQDDIEDPYDTPIDIKQEDVDSNLETRKKRNGLNKSFKIRKKIKDSHPCTCSVCGRQCPNPSTLMIHMRSHTNERPYSCPSCDKKYKDSGSLKRHAERNHLKEKRERKFICEICGKGFFSKNDIKIHMRVHTGETPYACAVCPARFTQINALHRHQVRHTGERAYACSTCHKKFCTKEELKNHYVAHTSTKNYTCPTCNTLFKYKNNLRKHIRMHSEVNRFICNYCGRSFAMKGNLKLHIKRLHSSKSGYCNICLKDVPNIEMHTWKHTGERPLKCDLCTSSFSERKALARHINFRHKYIDKYKCTINGCTVKFPSQQMLDFHVLKLHGNIVPFPCDKCSRGFYRKSDLARHKIGTHKERLTD
ncbi:zinc finger protein 484-like [Nymphalis io]|uniref:zinc finger protein 484-like n=1 Tax=Inachis io TaxID=171585 RepID=UPI002169BB78|nr:zinc finger protein 484-like [Nymphalis io]